MGRKPRAYYDLRLLIGILGMALPLIISLVYFILGNDPNYPGEETGFPDSISQFYRTKSRNVFVGFLCAIGIFLFTYKGYDSRDNRLGNIACLLALGTAFFPTTHPDPVIHYLHLGCAALFFVTLIIFSGYLFRKTDTLDPPRSKVMRNRIYLICAIVMTAGVILAALAVFVLPDKLNEKWNAVYWMEVLALEAFGISWLAKADEIKRLFEKLDR